MILAANISAAGDLLRVLIKLNNMSDQMIDVPKLLQAALGRADSGQSRGRAAITDLLKEVARQTDSFGCILWRQRRENRDQLSYMGGWFKPTKLFALPFVPREGSVAGKALNDGWAMSNDLVADGNITAHLPFFVEFHISRTVACRLPPGHPLRRCE